MSAAPPALAAGSQAVVAGTVTALNGYASSVNLTCIAGATAPPSTCTFNPSTVTPDASGASFTATFGSATAGSYSFGVQGVGTDSGATTHSTPVSLTVYDFQITASVITSTVSPGQTAAYSLNFTPTGAGTFQQVVTYTCSGLPGLSSCSFNPAQIASGNGITSVTLNISTTAPIGAARRQQRPGSTFPLYALILPLGLIVMSSGFSKRISRRKKIAGYVFITLMLALTMFQTACGGGGLTGSGSAGGNPGTPAGNYTVTVNSSEGTISHSVQVTLTVQ
jgi:hypothetical protein